MPVANAAPAARAGSQYMPYNDDPRNVGTLTGKAMPVGLQRDSDDYEDVLDYFPSDDLEHEGDMTGSTSTYTSAGVSRRDTSGRTVAASSSRTVVSRRTVAKTFTTGRTGGRSSRLGLASEDEDEGEGEGAYVDQAAEPQSPSPRRHGAVNGLRPPPSVNQPAPARLIPVSPDTNFDDMPSAAYNASPTSGRRTAASSRHVLPSSRASTSRRLLPDPDEDEDDQAGDDTADADLTAGDDTADADLTAESLGVEMGRDAQPSRRRSAKASSRRADMRASAETEVDAEEGDAGGDAAGFDQSMGYADEQMPVQDEYDAGGGDYDDEADAGGDLGMDDGDAGADSPIDEGGEDDEGSAAPAPKRKRGKDVKGKGKAKAGEPKAKVARAASAPRAKADRNRERSQSEILQPADTLRKIPDTGDRKRRLRTADERTTPLEYWRNERPQYTRRIHDGDVTIDAGTAVVEAWVRVPKEEPEFLGTKKRRGPGRPKSKGRDVRVPKTIDEEDEAEPDPYDVTGWDQTTEQSGLVINYSDGATVLRRIACTNAQLKPGSVLGANGENAFHYQKVFVEDPFFAAGVINMEVGGTKSTKPARDNTYVFFVYKGCVEISVHRTRSIVSEGGLFLIPRGNDYSLKNVCEKKVELFFAQARLLRSGEELPDRLTGEQVPVVGEPRSAGGRDDTGSPRVVNGNGKAARRHHQELEADLEDAAAAERSVTPVVKKARTGARR